MFILWSNKTQQRKELPGKFDLIEQTYKEYICFFPAAYRELDTYLEMYIKCEYGTRVA